MYLAVTFHHTGVCSFKKQHEFYFAFYLNPATKTNNSFTSAQYQKHWTFNTEGKNGTVVNCIQRPAATPDCHANPHTGPISGLSLLTHHMPALEGLLPLLHFSLVNQSMHQQDNSMSGLEGGSAAQNICCFSGGPVCVPSTHTERPLWAPTYTKQIFKIF